MASLPLWCAPLAGSADPRRALGYAGEVAAGRLLERHGFRIEAHRFRVGRHELDLVGRHGRLVVFLEVKTRRAGTLGRPEESLTPRQRRTLAVLAALWRARWGRPGDQYRFDLAAVSPVEDGWAIRWIRGAYLCDR